MKQELISVIMSVYNEEEPWLRKSIESILKQTYKNLQFIIVLDNPFNNTLIKLLDEYQKQDQRILILKNEKNIGLIASLNRALQHAQGKYVARMDADDISLPNRLQEEMSVMYKQNVDFVISSISFIDEKDHLLGTPDSENMNTAFFAEIMKYGNFSIHPTWLVKTKIYQDLHGYRELKYCEDYDFILRALEQGVTCYRMKDVLLKYRIRGSGISKTYSVEQDLKAKYLRNLYRRNISIKDQPVEELNYRFANHRTNSKYEYAIRKMENISINFAKKKYLQVLLGIVRNFTSNKYFRQNFLDALHCWFIRKKYRTFDHLH